MAKQPQHRHHPVDGVEQLLRRLDAARRVSLPQRQQVEQKVDEHLWVTADVAAVREHLDVDLGGQRVCTSSLQRAGALDAEAEFRERERRQQPVVADETAVQSTIEGLAMRRQRLHEPIIEAAVGAIEDDRRLRQPREHPARHDARFPGDGLRGMREGLEEFVDKHPAALAHAGNIGGAKVTQPAEARELPRPNLCVAAAFPAVRAVRLADEGRAASRIDDLAPEGEIAGADVGGDGRIARADILRRDQQPFGRLGAQAHRGATGQRKGPTHRATRASGEQRQDAQAIMYCRAGQDPVSPADENSIGIDCRLAEQNDRPREE